MFWLKINSNFGFDFLSKSIYLLNNNIFHNVPGPGGPRNHKMMIF